METQNELVRSIGNAFVTTFNLDSLEIPEFLNRYVAQVMTTGQDFHANIAVKGNRGRIIVPVNDTDIETKQDYKFDVSMTCFYYLLSQGLHVDIPFKDKIISIHCDMEVDFPNVYMNLLNKESEKVFLGTFRIMITTDRQLH